jgi:hypothetical protein
MAGSTQAINIVLDGPPVAVAAVQVSPGWKHPLFGRRCREAEGSPSKRRTTWSRLRTSGLPEVVVLQCAVGREPIHW